MNCHHSLQGDSFLSPKNTHGAIGVEQPLLNLQGDSFFFLSFFLSFFPFLRASFVFFVSLWLNERAKWGRVISRTVGAAEGYSAANQTKSALLTQPM